LKYVIENFNGIKGKACFYAAIRSVLVYNKLDFTDEEVFFLADGLGILYDADSRFIGSPMTSVGNLRKHDMFKINFSYISDMKEENWSYILDSISKNNIVLLIVNTKGLTYDDVYVKRSENFNHAILIYGMDTDNDIAFISDQDIREDAGGIRGFQGAASFNEIKDSAYAFIHIEVKTHIALDNNYILKCIYEGLEKFLKGGINDNKKPFGMLAVQEYVKDFEKMSNLDNNDFVQSCMKIHYNMKLLSVELGIDFIIDYLNNNVRLQKDGFLEFVSDLQFLKKEWTKAALLILKIGKMNRKDRIPEAMNLCNGIIEKQINVFSSFREYIKAIFAQ
jgi:hypothetical protein